MTARVRFRVCAAGLSAALLTLACAGPVGRIKDDAETDKVGNRSAGAATFQRLIDGAVQRLLASPAAAQRSASERFRIAFFDIENLSSEELLDWRDTLRQRIDQAVNASGRFRNVSDRYVRAALRATGLRPDDLYLPERRREFLRALEANSDPVDFFLYATLSSGTTRDNAGAQRDYLLTLELVDVKSGEAVKVQEDVRKEYLR